MAREEIIEKLNSIFSMGFDSESPIVNEAKVMYIMAAARKILEHSRKKSDYPLLSFFCNWSLHIKIDRNQPGVKILEDLDGAIRCNKDGDTRAILNQISEEVFLGKLRNQLLLFCKEHDLNKEIFGSSFNWKLFRKSLLNVLTDCPLLPAVELNYLKQFSFKTAHKMFNGKYHGKEAYVWEIVLNDGTDYAGPIPL